MTSGEQLKLEGMATTLAAAGESDHTERILAALSYLTKTGEAFSADHIRDRLPIETRLWMDTNYNVLPAIVGRHARAGHIRHIGWCSPARRTRHSNPNRLWIGSHA